MAPWNVKLSLEHQSNSYKFSPFSSSECRPALPEAWAPANAGAHAEPLYIYVIIPFFGDSVRVFFFVSASVCDSSRNLNSQSNSFVRAPSSGGGSNAPRPAVPVPHLDVNADRRRARQARSAFFFVCWAVYARAILGSWHI